MRSDSGEQVGGAERGLAALWALQAALEPLYFNIPLGAVRALRAQGRVALLGGTHGRVYRMNQTETKHPRGQQMSGRAGGWYPSSDLVMIEGSGLEKLAIAA